MDPGDSRSKDEPVGVVVGVTVGMVVDVAVGVVVDVTVDRIDRVGKLGVREGKDDLGGKVGVGEGAGLKGVNEKQNFLGARVVGG